LGQEISSWVDIAMAEFHRKIELQSQDDLQYLVSNIRRAANQKIDKDWPPIEGEDKIRERVEELVHSVCLLFS
jgi:kinetochor protein Mis14/NSL1